MTAHTAARPRLHVVFGTGPVGLALAERLLELGEPVRMVSRSGRRPADLHAAIDVHAADVTDTARAAEAAAGATHLYNALNAAHYQRWPEEFPPLYRGILAVAERVGARLIIMENAYMYGPGAPSPLRETLLYRAHGRRGETRAMLAHEMQAAHDAGRARIVTGRASDFYGPRVLDSFVGERLFDAALAGKTAQALISIDHVHTLHYMPDIARGLVTLALDESAYGRAWHLPAAPAITPRAFIEAVYAAAGTGPAKVQVLPGWAADAFGLLFIPALRGISEMAYEYAAPFIVDDGDYRARYGDHSTPIETAIVHTLAWYRARAAGRASAQAAAMRA
jgi:nucleoside-diphosphate-sugar epimerase